MSQSELRRADSMLPQVLFNYLRSGTQPLPTRGVRRVSVSRCDGNRHDACPVIQSSFQGGAGDDSIGVQHSPVSGDSGDAFADDEGVDVVGSFICPHCFEVREMPHDRILPSDSVGAEQVAAGAGN